ncbi:hypothetical protein D6D23_06605 [Aureobasidium pullulans]|nr:hypothetical protein D6D23_06605 [Aureobasidium pullulans]
MELSSLRELACFYPLYVFEYFSSQIQRPEQPLSFLRQFRHGTSHCEEMDMPPTLSMPALCVDWHIYTDAYFQEIAPFFPVIGREQIVRAATYLSRYDHLEERPTGDRPAIACVYAYIALGAPCALEQNLAFESGRPSSVRSCQFNRNILNAALDVLADFLKPPVNLAHIQSQITETLFDQSICATPPDLDALITLHRIALIDGLSADTPSVRAKGNHGRRLQKSEGICANLARDILTTYLQYIEQGHSSPFITLNQPLLAVYVLTVYNLRHRSAWSAHIDLALLGSSAKAIRDRYQEHGMPPGFCDMLATLERRATLCEQPEDGPITNLESRSGDLPWDSPMTDVSASVLGSELGPLDVDALLETQVLASLQSQEMAFESSPLHTIPGIEDQDLREWLNSPRLSDEEILSYRL